MAAAARRISKIFSPGALFVHLFHRGEFAGEAAGRRFEDLPLGIALLGLVVGTEQVADHFGDRHQVARIDLGFIFLRAARPHGALDLGLALQRFHRLAHGLVRGQFAHADRLGLVGRNAERHALLFKPQHIEFELHPCDFLLLQLDNAAHAMLGVHDIVTDVEVERLGSHWGPFRIKGLRTSAGRAEMGPLFSSASGRKGRTHQGGRSQKQLSPSRNHIAWSQQNYQHIREHRNHSPHRAPAWPKALWSIGPSAGGISRPCRVPG